MATALPGGDRWFRGVTTERLTIGRLVHDDAATLSAYRSDPDVAIFQDWDTPFSASDATAFIASMEHEAPLTPGEWFQFAIRRHGSPELLGDVALHRHGDDPTHLTVGYTLAKTNWGHGYATEAVAAVLEYAATGTDATRISAEALASNAPSLALLQRLGFEQVNRIERADQIDGVWHDEVIYQRTEDQVEPAIGVILTGGASSRMGTPKAQVSIGQRSMFDWVARAFEQAGLEIVVSGTAPTPDHPYEVISDRQGVAGPVGGIASVLSARSGTTLLVVATDQPYVTPTTLRRLLAQPGPLVAPTDDGRVQVTCAVYRPEILPTLEQLLAEDPAPSIQRSARDIGTLVQESEWTTWGEDGRSWRSLDTPDAATSAVTDLGEPI